MKLPTVPVPFPLASQEHPQTRPVGARLGDTRISAQGGTPFNPLFLEVLATPLGTATTPTPSVVVCNRSENSGGYHQ